MGRLSEASQMPRGRAQSGYDVCGIKLDFRENPITCRLVAGYLIANGSYERVAEKRSYERKK